MKPVPDRASCHFKMTALSAEAVTPIYEMASNMSALGNISSTSDWIERFRYACEVGISLPVACLGLIGNIFAFIVLSRQKPRKNTARLLLQAISVTDFLTLLCSIPLRSLRVIVPGYGDSDFFLLAFRWLYPAVYLFRFSGSWMTVLLTVDRFIAVRYPLSAQHLCTVRRTYVLMAALSIVATLFTLPRFFEYRTVIRGDRLHGVGPSGLMTHRGYTIGYRISAFLVVMYLVPMCSLVVLNFWLLQTLRQARARRRILLHHPRQTNFPLRRFNNPGVEEKVHSPHHAAQHSITVIVLTVVLVSIISNSTAMVAHVLWSLDTSFPEIVHLERYRRVLSNLSNALVTINSAINFLIYCLCSKNFRQMSAQTLGCLLCCWEVRRSRPNPDQMAMTNLSQLQSSNRNSSQEANGQIHDETMPTG